MTVVQATKKAAWEPRPKVRLLGQSPSEDGSSRPLTATLDHPLVLNVALISKLDMTALTREGLRMVSKLCAVPMIKTGAKQRNRRVSPSRKDKNIGPVTDVKGTPKKGHLAVNHTMDDLFGNTLALPEPCRTCGRPEQPERLHSHPSGPQSATKQSKKTSKPAAKMPINKPVPANFKSSFSDAKTSDNSNDSSRPRSGPRTITCYICSRDFGTASLPLHEPKCKQKWERENQALPPALRRQLPPKPLGNLNRDEWNELAWQLSQAALLPCDRCGRTFNQDALAVHMRGCKARSGQSASPQATHSRSESAKHRTVPCYICAREFGSRSISIHEPQCLRKWTITNSSLPEELQLPIPKKPDLDISRITGCYLCGQPVAAKDKMSHEKSCLQSWRRENSARPVGKRLPEPQRPDFRFTEGGEVDYHNTWQSIWANHMESLIPCRQCGRKFFPDRIEKHESACANLPIKSKTFR